MTSLNKTLVAINEANVNAGAIVWWRLTDAVSVDRLAAAWTMAAHPMGLLPNRSSGFAALRSALQDVSKGNRVLVRPLEGRIGFALVDEEASRDDLQYDVRVTVKLDDNEDVGLIFSHAGGQESDIEKAFNARKGSYSGGRIGSWLSDLAMHQCSGISLRPTGGVYFIPRDSVEQFRSYADALEMSSACTVYEVPAMESESAVKAILDALMAEAETEVEEIATDLAPDTHKKSLNSRKRRCEAMGKKLEAYADLLGDALDGIKAKLDVTHAKVVEALLDDIGDQLDLG